jgi:hypothetical protein
MKQIFLSLAAVFLTLGVMAQSARVQVIHNSPTPGTDSGPTVDIYVNGDLLEELTAVPFRAATPFLDVPAGVDITVAVAVNPSNDVNDAIATFDLGQLDDGGTYVVMAHGIVGNATTPFNLAVNADARETSAIDGNVDFSVFHGSTDAPPVDVEARGAGLLVSGLDYPSFTDEYYSVPATNYTLDIRASGQTEIVASFVADLSGLANGVATVFASGLLNGTPSFGLFAALTDGTVVAFPAEAALPTLVINEVDYDQPGADNAEFIEILNVGDETVSLNGVEIALFNGGTNEIYSTTKLNDVELKSGEYYVVCYGNNTAEYCNQTVASGVQNGAPDGVQLLFNGEVIDAISYEGTLAGVAEGTGTSAADSNTEADVSLSRSPNGVDTDNNDNDFILACFSPGAENNTSLSCTAVTDSAMVQIIHNSPTPTVDIYANGDILLDDFEFRDATPFVSVPAGVEIDIAVAGASSSSAADAIANFPVTFTANETYIVVATGIVGNAETPFELAVYDMGRKQGNSPTDVDILVYHGATDAPAVDVRINGPGAVIVDDLAYKQFEDYQSVPAAEYFLDITPGDDNTMLVGTYRADVTSLGGSALTVFASGLLAGDPDFGLWVADVDGNTFGLERVYLDTANVQIIHNSPTTTVDIYANGELLEQDFEYGSATPYLRLPAGMEFEIAVAPAPSTSAADAVATFNVTFEANRSYAVVANGVPGDMDDPFNLEVNDQARTSALDAGNIDILAFHGSASSPAVDIAAKDVATLITNLSYTAFSDYVPVPSGAYTIEIKPTGTEDVVASFEADLAALAGQSVTVIARGDLAGGDIPFGLLAVLADGTTLPLPETPTANVQVIHNAIGADTVDIYAGEDLLLDNFAFRTATPFVELPAEVTISLGVAPSNSTSSADAIATFDVTLEADKTYVVIAKGILGDDTAPFGLVVNDMGQTAAAATGVDLLLYHGSPDAPEVDVLTSGNVIYDNVAFDGFSNGYLNVPAGEYVLDLTPSEDNNTVVASYVADVSGLEGGAAVVFASGLFSGEDPAFAVWVALPDGTTFGLPVYERTANVQVIHNAIGADTVDIYAGDELLLDNFAFRTATPFVELPAEVTISLGVAPSTSASSADAIATFDVTLETDSTYVVIAKGILGDDTTPFGLAVNDMGQTAAASGTGVDLLLYHGSPDAPEVDVLTGGNVIYDNVAFDGFSNGYLNVPAGEYVLDLTPSEDNNTVVASYVADVSGLEGGAAVVFASGLFSGEDPAFAVWVALADGTTFALPLSTNTNELERIVAEFTMAPNPAFDQTTLSFGLSESTDLNIAIFGLNGQLFQTLDLGTLPKGQHTQNVVLNELPTGQYVISLISNKGVIAKKLIVTE